MLANQLLIWQAKLVYGGNLKLLYEKELIWWNCLRGTGRMDILLLSRK